MRTSLLPIPAILFLGLFLFSPVFAADRVTAKFLSNTATLSPNQTFKLGILLTIQPGWHVYWKNPGDAGLPTTVQFTLPPGFQAGPLQYPLPTQFDQPGGLIAYGYEKSVLLTADIKSPANLDPNTPVKFSADVSWLSCADVCIPGSAKLDLTFPMAPSSTSSDTSIFHQWQDRMPLATPSNLNLQTSGNMQQGYEVTIQWQQDVTAVRWFPEAAKSFAIRDIEIQTQGQQSRIRFKIHHFPNANEQERTVPGLLTYVDPQGQQKGFQVQLPVTE